MAMKRRRWRSIKKATRLLIIDNQEKIVQYLKTRSWYWKKTKKRFGKVERIIVSALPHATKQKTGKLFGRTAKEIKQDSISCLVSDSQICVFCSLQLGNENNLVDSGFNFVDGFWHAEKSNINFDKIKHADSRYDLKKVIDKDIIFPQKQG